MASTRVSYATERFSQPLSEVPGSPSSVNSAMNRRQSSSTSTADHFHGELVSSLTGDSCINSVEANSCYCPLRTVSSCFASSLYLPCCGSRRSHSLQPSPRHEHPCIKHCDIWRFRRRQRCNRTATIPFYRRQQQPAYPVDRSVLESISRP